MVRRGVGSWGRGKKEYVGKLGEQEIYVLCGMKR